MRSLRTQGEQDFEANGIKVKMVMSVHRPKHLTQVKKQGYMSNLIIYFFFNDDRLNHYAVLTITHAVITGNIAMCN